MFDEKQERLSTILELVNDALAREDMLVSTARLLRTIRAVAAGDVEPADPLEVAENIPEEKKVIISCDASLVYNPGGPAAVGVVIEDPERKNHLFGRLCRAETSNQAEYDAIYTGLVTFCNFVNSPRIGIEIRSDSKCVISQLNNDIACTNEDLVRRKNSILELVSKLPVPVTFKWRPRCSNMALKLADALARQQLDEIKENRTHPWEELQQDQGSTGEK